MVRVKESVLEVCLGDDVQLPAECFGWCFCAPEDVVAALRAVPGCWGGGRNARLFQVGCRLRDSRRPQHLRQADGTRRSLTNELTALLTASSTACCTVSFEKTGTT